MLLRRLGSLDGAAVVIANVIGTGIFLTPAFIAERVPSAFPFLGLWLLGGVLAVIGALSYAELAAMRPSAGGEYVYIREAFGALPGFLSGWTSLVAGFSGAIAAAAVGFAIYLDRLIPGAGSDHTLLQVSVVAGLGVTVTPRVLVALALIGLFTLIHAAGLGPGRVAMQALAWLNVATILALVVLGFLAEGGDPGVAAAAPTAGPRPLEIGGALVALVLVMFTYSGWNAAAYIAGEFRDPGRSVPRALLGGTLVVTGLYLALNLLYVRVLGIAGIATAEATGDRVVDALWGDAGAWLFTPVVLLVLASSVSAMVLTGPRVYYAMARDRCLPAPFARLAGRRVPAFSIGVQAAWSAVLVLTGGFEALLTYTGVAVVLFAGLGVAALFVLRWREPGALRPFRVWGYPLAPAFFVLTSLAMVTQTILRAPGPSLAGVALISLGAPVFLWVRKRAAGRPARTGGHTREDTMRVFLSATLVLVMLAPPPASAQRGVPSGVSTRFLAVDSATHGGALPVLAGVGLGALAGIAAGLAVAKATDYALEEGGLGTVVLLGGGFGGAGRRPDRGLSRQPAYMTYGPALVHS